MSNQINMKKIDNTSSFYQFLLKQINYNYNYKNRGLDTYPAPQPVSIEKKDIVKLTQYNYNIGLKLDGIRYLLFLIKDNLNNNSSILINRSLEFFSINLNLNNDDLYINKTLLDGELCNNEYIIHDSVLINGIKIRNMHHDNRLSIVSDNLKNIMNNEVLIIKIKKFYKYTDFDNFIKNEYNINNNNDGIIFMPNNLSVMSGTQYSLFKWKPLNKHSFDFLIKEENKNLEAYVYHLKNITLFAKINYNDENGKIFIDTCKKLENYKNECITECYFENNNFIPILIRTDKHHSNSLRTIERTLFNVNENIQLNDFVK